MIFALSGVGLATWFSRVPTSRDHLGASTSEMGALVLGLSIGSIAGLLLSNRILARLGPRRTILSSLALTAVSFVVLAVGTAVLAAYGVAFVALALYGMGAGTCNVAMNVEAAAVERRIGRSLMPLFHASFSLGNVIGAALGAVAEAASIDLPAHFGLVAVLIAVGAAASVRRFQPHEAPGRANERESTVAVSAWREPRTLLIGLVVLGTSFAMGAANDWVALAMVDGHGVNNATGAVAVGVFVTFTTVARVCGAPLLDRLGRVWVLRASALLAVAGLLIFILVPDPVTAMVGVALWGLGAALGFPVGMSAAADDPAGAPKRISAVATIGYFASLVGPLSIGVLGEATGLLPALLIVVAFVIAAGAASPAVQEAKPLRSQGEARGELGI